MEFFSTSLKDAFRFLRAHQLKEAQLYLERACEENDPYAYYIMGYACEFGGWGYEMCPDTSEFMFSRSAELKCLWGQARVKSYSVIDVPQDDNYGYALCLEAGYLHEAYFEYLLACKNGFYLGAPYIARHYVGPRIECDKLLKLAADWGEAESQYMYYERLGDFSNLIKSAEQGYFRACKVLGKYYLSRNMPIIGARWVLKSKLHGFIGKRIIRRRTRTELAVYGEANPAFAAFSIGPAVEIYKENCAFSINSIVAWILIAKKYKVVAKDIYLLIARLIWAYRFEVLEE